MVFDHFQLIKFADDAPTEVCRGGAWDLEEGRSRKARRGRSRDPPSPGSLPGLVLASNIPELLTLAVTVGGAWSEINAFITTGITSAHTVGRHNRLVKQVERSGCGFPKPTPTNVTAPVVGRLNPPRIAAV